MSFSIGGSERARINSAGDFLIGDSSGGARLYVKTSETKGQNATPFVLSTNDTNKFELIFSRSTNSYYKIQAVEQNVGYRDIVMQSDGGKLGVGTTSPQRLLDVRGYVNLGTSQAYVGASGYADIHLRTYSGTPNSPAKIQVVDNWFDCYSTYTDGFRWFNWSSDGVSAERMRLTGDGNLGIGTSTPFSGTKLTANGTIQVGYVDASNAALQLSWNGASSYGKIQTFSSSSLALNPDGNNVGVGTTNPTAKLHVLASTPSGITSPPSGTTIRSDSSTDNYLSFVNTADNGTYAGITMTDNNIAAYIVFRNYTSSGVSVGSDSMIYGSYNDHIFQAGSSGTVNGKPEVARLALDGTFTLQNRLVTNSTGVAVTLNSGGDIVVYSVSNSYGGTIFCDPPQSGMASGGASNGYVWVTSLMNYVQRTSYDRQWNNEPSITVLNDTAAGSQSTFRIHGAPGNSGGDYSVNLVVDGTITALSDARVKTEITPIQNALATVCQLQGKTFKFVNSDLEIQTHTSMADGRKFGFIAQEIKDIIPETVIQATGPDIVENENGVCREFTVDYASIVALLAESIKELKTELDSVKSELATIKKIA
jgi:hypothetical protein